ncbi:MAG: hypothetical protein J6D52_04705 [Clostridia bacterium]|nr:hypothetical protein [Clostridia bacterium]
MKTVYSHDFFYYNSDFKKEHNDFTGDDGYSAEERKSFLKNYANFLKKYYNLPEIPRGVITDEELKREMSSLDLTLPCPKVSEKTFLNRMKASLVSKTERYKSWQLYTNKARFSGEKVVFDSDDLPPTAAAAYYFDNKKRLGIFEFSFFMNKEYCAEIPGDILDTTYGRTVELRSGIDDVIKLQFYSDGRLFARLGNTCPYHLKNVYIGDFKFEEEQSVILRVTDSDFKVELNGNISDSLPLSSNLNPDTLFVGSGMFNVGEWSFTPKKLTFGDQEICDFFVEEEPSVSQIQPLGDVTLPFSVGGYENRNKYLILEQNFTAPKGMQAFLNIESLDPCGSVYINDRLIAKTNGFDSLKIEITDFLREDINHIKIIVDPRAPEVLFNWHRQKDAHNGWFCNSVWIDFYNKIKIDSCEAVALSVENNDIVCKLKANVSEDCRVKAYIRKIFPQNEETESFIGELAVKNNRAEATLSFKADAWTPDTPDLYAVRFVAIDNKGDICDDAVIETGFRTIRQSSGKILLNGKPIVLTGALLMQFLPPHSETPITHICPTTEQVLWQELMVKRMNGNTMRIHILGYGTNDARYARIADRIGLMLIWTTRYIDSVEQMALEDFWAAKNGYLRQVKERINHPSIIMWEGTNEYHPTLNDIDRIYEAFVPAVKSVDTSRLLCPISHLYYAGDMIPKPNCAFYNDNGTADHFGNPAEATSHWTDELVVRSAHTYEVLLGYGTPWRKMRNQEWSMQKELFESEGRAYIVSEFAVTARQNSASPKAKEFFNKYSYEFPDEDVLGFRFCEEEWEMSQAYQALAAKFNVKVLREQGADGMLWCCLMGGANDGGYLKPPIDCYGYPKFAFYTIKEGYSKLYAADSSLDALRPKDFSINPMLFGTEEGKEYDLTVTLTDSLGEVLEEKLYYRVKGREDNISLTSWKPEIKKDGYYALKFKIKEL